MLRRLALLALPWIAACTHDFGSFSYRDDGGSSITAAAQPGSDAAPPQRTDAGDARAGSGGARGEQRPDAASDGGEHPQTGVEDASTRDASMATSDAGEAADAGSDAGAEPPSPETLSCRGALQANAASESCGSCGCEHCAGEVASCLGSGDQDSDPLCAAVVACAIQNDCRFWGCYCRTPQCGRNSPTGDGPCVAQIEAAAGGSKAIVMAKWTSSDLADPLVRSRNLVACTLGLDAQHPLGPITGQCVEACR
jgi:hypothetical protein